MDSVLGGALDPRDSALGGTLDPRDSALGGTLDPMDSVLGGTLDPRDISTLDFTVHSNQNINILRVSCL